MDQKTLEIIKNQLLERKKKLEEELSGITSKDPHVKDNYDAKFPEFGSEEGENAAEIAEYTVNLSSEQILEGILRDINKALERIEKGTYGICQYCEKPIDEKR